MRQARRQSLLYALTLAGLLLSFDGCSRADTSPRPVLGNTPRVATATLGNGTPSPMAVTPTLTVREVIATAVAKRPDDFAFAFVAASCGESVTMDTFVDTFTVFVPQDGRYNAGTRTIPFALTPDEVRVVYRQMVIGDFFAYPPSLNTSSPRQGGRASDYDFRVRRDGRVQVFHWTTTGTSMPTEMERDLGDLTRHLQNILYAHPEAQAVPRGVGCT